MELKVCWADMNHIIIGSLESAGDLQRRIGPGLLVEPLCPLGAFITRHSAARETETKHKYEVKAAFKNRTN